MKAFSKVLYFNERIENFHTNISIRSPIDIYEYTEYLINRCQEGWARWCDNLEVKNGVCKTMVEGIEYDFYISADWCIEVEETQDENL